MGNAPQRSRGSAGGPHRPSVTPAAPPWRAGGLRDAIGHGGSPVRQPRIVVADDDPIVTRFLTSVFQSEGFDVRSAEDGEGALRMIRENHPDIVILDLVMPFMDGFEVCRQLRQTTETSRV